MIDRDSSSEALHSVVWALRGLGFFSGGAVMIVEFAGNRLLTPIFGNSLYTWTGLIGVILVALSFGDYYGGRLADKLNGTALLAGLFSFAGVLTAGVPIIAAMISPSAGLGAVAGAVISSMALFFMPGLLLAAVTPVSIRLLSGAFGSDKVGTAAGTVGMAAALGSFAGTFLTSYVLIPHFGVRAIFSVLGAILIGVGMALAYLGSRRGVRVGVPMKASWGIGLLICVIGHIEIPREDQVYAEDTFYHRITVLERDMDGVRSHVLVLDSTIEGGMGVDTGELVVDYQKFWELAEIFAPSIDRAVFLGAGAFGMPEHLSSSYPEARVEVVEIDPAVIAVGRRFFRLDEFPRVHAYAEDGRRFLVQSEGNYDLVFGDAYNGVQYIPAHLVTSEFFGLVKSKLKPGGIYMMNLIGATSGSSSELFWAVRNTMGRHFPHQLVYAAEGYAADRVQNLIIVASDRPLQPRLDAWRADSEGQGSGRKDALLAHAVAIPAQPEFTTVFTDNRNPVEYVIAGQLLR